MAYNRSKSKTSRRVKRAKTNKRNTARKQTFRKSKRINRGGMNPQKRSNEGDGYESQVKKSRVDYVPGSMEDKLLSNKENKENNNNDPHKQAQIEHEKMKDAEIEKKKEINIRNKRYREPLYPGNTEVVYVNQTPQLEITERQYEFEDMMDAEDPNRLKFGGKKKRATRRK